jgi:hypothetical protein
VLGGGPAGDLTRGKNCYAEGGPSNVGADAKTGIAVVGALAFIFALTGEISADVRFGLHVSVEADGGGDLGVHPGVRVVGRVDGVSVSGPGSSQTSTWPGDLSVDPEAT